MSIYFQRDKIMILVIFIFFCLYVQYYSGDTRKDNEIIDVSLDKVKKYSEVDIKRNICKFYHNFQFVSNFHLHP